MPKMIDKGEQVDKYTVEARMKFSPVKGTRDFYPTEMLKRNWLFEKYRSTARQFNFEEYDACVLEHEELYKRKAGDEITNQLYSFSDKGGRQLALRPEMTPSLARMILAREKTLQYPLRWFSISQCFRYERMQKGRKREHFQWNMDIIGDHSLTAEAELLAAIVDFCSSIELREGDIHIKFSNRKILQEMFQKIGIPDSMFMQTCVIVDKYDKIGEDNVAALLAELKMPRDIIMKLIALLNTEDEKELVALNERVPKGLTEARELIDICRSYGIDKYMSFDMSVVRGLSYYTGTVFEVYDMQGKSRAICGGGRYDKLIETYGGPSVPMVGFGFGDVVISDILEERNLFPQDIEELKYLVIAYSQKQRDTAIRIVSALRKTGASAEIDLSFRKLQKTYSRADKRGFHTAILVAPEELKEKRVVVKNLKKNTEKTMNIDELCASFA